MTNIKIKGLKKAVGDYQRANSDGAYSPRYGYLMYDTEDGELWVDEFYSIGENQWKQYKSASVVNLGFMMAAEDMEVTMANVRCFIVENFKEVQE